jgi:uncharacterized membrane protein
MNERLIYFLIHNFWRLAGAAAGLLLGLLWAFFGVEKALLVLVFCLAGYFLGKRRDEGRSRTWLDKSLK